MTQVYKYLSFCETKGWCQQIESNYLAIAYEATPHTNAYWQTIVVFTLGQLSNRTKSRLRTHLEILWRLMRELNS